ncbi:MAG: cytidine deaminase [Turicibacter sp.]|nr:cytidine deaminase [Turicibacter sp.]
MNDNDLVKLAFDAKEKSYSPYSQFQVGAALLAKNGDVYTGCNIESASYSPTNCAERTAFFKAVSEGVTDFAVIAVVGGQKGAEVGLCYPCGVCRQVMAEFCDSDFKIIMADAKGEKHVCTLDDILPYRFGPSDLQGGHS